MLARNGYVVLTDNNYPDYSWMVEGIEDEFAKMTDGEIDELVENQADAYDQYIAPVNGEPLTEDWEVEQAKVVLKKLRDN